MVRYVILAILCGAAAIATAKPKVAIGPIKGDLGGKLADALAELYDGKAKVISPSATEAAMDKLKLSGELDDKGAKKVLAKLSCDAVVSGHVEKKGKKKTVKIVVHAKGADPVAKVFPFKSVEVLKDDNKDDLLALIDNVTGSGDDEDDKPKKAFGGDDDKPKKHDDDKPRKVADDDAPKKHGADDDKPKKAKDKAVARDDDDGKVRKRKRHDDDDDAKKPSPPVGPMLRVDAGALYGVRRLTYTSSSTNPPPTTGTATPSGRIAVEAYPVANAALGLFGGYDKSVGLKIQIPGSQQTVSIDQAHYWIGAGYRLAVGASSVIGFGIAYDRRHYIADRSALVNADQLDTPDTDYAAAAPGMTLAVGVTPKVKFVAGAEALAILSAGSITSSKQYGHATAYGAAATAGIDALISDSVLFHVAAEFDQVSFSFDKMNGANQRGVSAAVDRSFGLAATLGVVY